MRAVFLSPYHVDVTECRGPTLKQLCRECLQQTAKAKQELKVGRDGPEKKATLQLVSAPGDREQPMEYTTRPLQAVMDSKQSSLDQLSAATLDWSCCRARHLFRFS